MTAVVAFLILVLQLVALYAISTRINRALYGIAGVRLYLLLALPGVMVHEFSHLVACWLTGTRVLEVRLFSPRQEGEDLVLGYVRHELRRNPVASTVIGAAPFFGGAAALLVMFRIFFPAETAAVLDAGTDVAGGAIAAYAGLFSSAWSAFDPADWRTYAFIYVVSSVATHLAPSRPDLGHALWGAFALASFGAGWWFVGSRIGIGVPEGSLLWAGGLFTRLSALLSFAIGVDALILAIVWPISRLRSPS